MTKRRGENHEGRFEKSLFGWRHFLQRLDRPGELVVAECDGIGAEVAHERGFPVRIIGELVVLNQDLVRRIVAMFFADRDHRRAIPRMRPLLQGVAPHDQGPPIGEVDKKARIAFGAVFDDVVDQFRGQGAGLYVMADPLIYEMAVLDAKFFDWQPDIDAVSASGDTGAVSLKIAVADDDRAASHAGQYSLFIADKARILHGEIEPLASYAGAIMVANLCPGECDAPDRHVRSANDEYSLAAADLVRHDDIALADDGQGTRAGGPKGAID